ncbi:MAG: hypothetical protein KC910_14245 [Candidatus Eremiobacteraeota bacterium]|nr:hypothetical protein [Candidatus Eremiobacteraeota bacterium]
MRANDARFQRAILNNLESARSRLTGLQEQISSGQRLTRPSEDPSAYARKSRVQAAITRLETDQGMVEESAGSLRYVDQTLGDLTAKVRSLRTIVQRASNGSTGPQLGESMAQEVDSILQSAVNLSNSEINGTYMLSGFKSRTPPFQVQKSGETITSVTYAGDLGSPPLNLPDGKTLNIALNGQSVSSGSGEDFFQTAIELRDALTQPGFDAGPYLDKLEKIESNLLTRRAEAASAGQYLESLSANTGEKLINLNMELQDLSGVDLPSAITQMLSAETTVQATMQVASRVSQLSLVNYLR